MSKDYADDFPYFIICTVRAKDPDKLKKLYKRFVAKNFKKLKEIDNGKMFDGNKFKELKGFSFNYEMKMNFISYFCRPDLLEIYYIKVLNKNLSSPKLYKNTARAFNYLYKLMLQCFLKKKLLPNDEYMIQFDNRNQKNESINSLEDYLNMTLHFEGYTDEITIKYFNSENNCLIQIADVFSNIFYSYCINEKNYNEEIKKLKSKKVIKGIFQFPIN